MKPFQKGYSLIEVIIVLAIIGVLAVVGLRAYRGYIQNESIVKLDRQYSEVVSIARATFEKGQENLAIGQSIDVPSTGDAWVALLNQGEVVAPGDNSSAYISTAATKATTVSGAISVLASDTSSVTITRPCYPNEAVAGALETTVIASGGVVSVTNSPCPP